MKQDLSFKDYHYVDELSSVYAGTSSTSPVHLHLTETRYENLESERDAEIHSAIYNPYCDSAPLKQKTVFPSQNHSNYVSNGIASADVHSVLPYSNQNAAEQQSFFYPPLVSTSAVHSSEPATRNTLTADYFSRESYQQQPYYQPSSYSNDMIESDPLTLLHRDAPRSEKEAATVSPIINIQDLTGYTGKQLQFAVSCIEAFIFKELMKNQ